MATLVNESMASSPSTGTKVTNSGTTGWNAGGYYTFTDGNTGIYTDLEYTGNITTAWTMTVDMQVTPTGGADSCWFYWGWNVSPQQENDSTNAGYLVERNDFDGHIRIRFGGTELQAVAWTPDTSFDAFEVDQAAGVFTVKNAGSTVFTYTDGSYPRSLPGTKYGWGGRTGFPSTLPYHNVDDLLLVTNGVAAAHNLSLTGVGS